MTNTQWTGMAPVDDTTLAVTDTGGAGTPVIYLNGQFATQGYWRHTIAELGPGWRHITYDMRARGKKSGRSADYSFQTMVTDVDAVLAARKVDRAVVAGWSYGAFVAAHWASRNPERALGAAMVEGAQPYDWLDDAMEQRIRRQFRRFRPLMALMRDRPDPADDGRRDGRVQHRTRQDRPRERDGPGSRRHHGAGSVCGRVGVVPRQQGRRAGADPREPPGCDRTEPEHQDQREGREQPRHDPEEGLRDRRQGRTRRRRHPRLTGYAHATATRRLMAA
ncbi:alpha/beta fold hydrolase [Kitasatospora sp. NPDC088346]|uniref:alpha/beta fold hydrolase n=1 Tax=Kitasatospora sp. NPDC088346 TaxID=3364073 RepID=UPI0038108947